MNKRQTDLEILKTWRA